ncbi:hypothetical protein CERZMDRAFT_43641 [Cercospora zeae-maydis SCOH1-5]|uniref:JmjC domain-containing protein n=1 Tax=Cercospora zeae-maydis SCOH1-5 TaxID=717836 RepID=A0A6A6FDD3_9PEZI|nr:hypothetical protein CERZMDRAFT_43641 [Cercospora zeae-maydis SCOH1-5]
MTPQRGTVEELTSRIRRKRAHSGQNVNALSLPLILRANPPAITRCPRLGLLSDVIPAAKTRAAASMEKQLESTPFDVESCEGFSIYGDAGVFSGMHRDFLGGTWLRNIFGMKLWWFVPWTSMTDVEKEDFQDKGYRWNPGSKARALLIKPDQVLVMPSPLPHAVLTVENCLMEGGMFWDRENITGTLENLQYTMKNWSTTNELPPFQLPDIIDELERMTKGHRSIRAIIDHLRTLGCQCRGICSSRCKCRSTRCTRWCTDHPTLPLNMACMLEAGE